MSETHSRYTGSASRPMYVACNILAHGPLAEYGPVCRLTEQTRKRAIIGAIRRVALLAASLLRRPEKLLCVLHGALERSFAGQVGCLKKF